MNDETLRKYYTSYTVMLKILKYRGYYVSKKYEKTREEFDYLYSEYTELSAVKTAMSENMIFRKGGSPVMVIWIHERKLGSNVRDVVSTLEENDILNAFIIADEGPTPQVGEVIKSLKVTKNIHIDIWTLHSSMVFIPDHKLVPKHRICSTRERKVIYDAYNLKVGDQKIPRLPTSDAIVKFLGASKGNLVEITRLSETDPSKWMLSYRIVY